MDGFKEGYSFASKTGGFQYASAVSEEYVAEVETEISTLLGRLVDLAQENPNKQNNIFGGDIAEVWHEGTFNISAAAHQSIDRATALRENGLGSADVVLESGRRYSLKYYASPETSAKAQAVTAFEEYRRNGGRKSLEEYLQLHPEMTEEQAIASPLYENQYRLVPDDHLDAARSWLHRKALEESYRGDGQADRYQDALDMLAESDGHAVVDNENGVRSVPLTKAQSTKLAQLAKENDIDPKEWGLTPDQFIKFEDVLRGSFKAGLSAATIDVIFKLAPEIYKALDYLVKNGRIDPEELKKLGLLALKGAGQGFFFGSLTYGIVTSCKAGMLGTTLKAVNPHAVGMLAIIAYDTIGNSIKVVKGEMTSREMLNAFASEAFISAFALAGGSFLSTGLGPIGYMLGSFIGSIIGGLTYQAGKRIVVSLCVESGFTLFGLVQQDYILPPEVIARIGGGVFMPERFTYAKFSPKKISSAPHRSPAFKPERFKYETFELKPLRRGVYSVSRIGYVY